MIETTYTAPGYLTGLHGFNGIRASETGISLRLTGKAMGDRYTDGFSLDTIGELCDRITGTSLIRLTPTDLLGGIVRRADPFADVLTDDLEGVPDAVRLIGRTFGEGTRCKGRGDAVTLYHNLPDGQGVLRGYPKGLQLSKAPHADFRAAYPGAVASVEGRHRMEVEARTYHAIRRVAFKDRGACTVADVLNSKRSPVADALDAMLATWTERRRALHSLTSVPNSVDAFLSLPSAAIGADGLALVAALIADLVEGDYTAACEIARQRYGSKNGHRAYPALRAACEAYQSPEAVDLHSAAVEVLRVVSGRVREREAA